MIALIGESMAFEYDSYNFSVKLMGYALRRQPPIIAQCSRIVAELGIFGTQTCHSACLVDSLWRPGGPWDDLGTLESTTKETLRSMLRVSSFFGGFKDLISRAFYVPWTEKGVFVHACLQIVVSGDFWV